MTGRRDVLDAVVAGTGWFWGAQLAAAGVVGAGGPRVAADVVVWGGVLGAAWVLSGMTGAGRGAVARLAAAALVIALPEAMVLLARRAAAATTAGLRSDVSSLGADAATSVLLHAGLLLGIAVTARFVRGTRLTSAGARSPT